MFSAFFNTQDMSSTSFVNALGLIASFSIDVSNNCSITMIGDAGDSNESTLRCSYTLSVFKKIS